MSEDHSTDNVSQIPAPEPPTSISDSVWANATEKWVGTCVRNSPISHDSGAWNRLNEVLPKLREFLEAELSKKE